MKKGIVFALVAAFVLLVPAGIAAAGQNDVIREGSCGNASDWKVKVSPENGRLEVEFEVDQNVSGDRWRVSDPARRRPRVPWHPHDARRERFVHRSDRGERHGGLRRVPRTGAEPVDRRGVRGERHLLAGWLRRPMGPATDRRVLRLSSHATGHRYHEGDGSGVLRPRQDDHLALVLARPVPADVPGGDGHARAARARRVRAARLRCWSARTRRRWSGSRRGCSQLTRGWDRHEVERLVEDVLIDVIDPFVYQEALDLMELHRVRGTGHLHRELLARGGRPSARAALRRGGRARDARAARGRALHGRARVLLLRRAARPRRSGRSRRLAGSTSSRRTRTAIPPPISRCCGPSVTRSR